MEQYIPKSAVVAEIERLITPENRYSMDKLLDFIDTLEVKEVDLEKEIDDAFLENKCNITDNVSLGEFERIAKHFFELGLREQKGE